MRTNAPTRFSSIGSRLALRALVSRPRREAAELAAELASRGIAAILEPLIDIHYRSEPAPDLAGVQGLLCTSANGVRALARLTTERHRPLLAVGDATAARARAEGFIAVESAGGDVNDLARLACRRFRPAGGPLFHVAGSAIAGDLAGALAEHGFAVEHAVLYEARPVATLSAGTMQAFAGGMIDFALFFSPRTAAVFVSLCHRAELEAAMRRVVAVSISPAADAALGELPFRARQIAEAPTRVALLDALDGVLAALREDAR